MSDRIEIDKPLIDPIYSQDEPNEPIDLGQMAVQFEHGGKVYQKTADVKMKFLPKDNLLFDIPLEDDDPWLGMKLMWSSGGNVKLTLPERSITIDALYKPTGEEGKIVFSSAHSAITVTQPSKAISTATFHLFNFPDFRSPDLDNYILRTGKPPLQGGKTYGRVVLKADGWIITIAATDRAKALEEKLNAQGGYVITYMGQIVREDGKTFTSEQLDELLTCLQYFLSFSLGCWAGAELPIGFDSSGNRVFERWGIGRTAAGHWKSYCSWFDRQHGELLSQVFPGFMSIWKRELWRKPLAHVLYWYLGAYKGGAGSGVDTGLILAQTALELLAWTHCVQDRKIVSPKKFKPGGLSAAKKFRLLTSSLGIPEEIPHTLSALHGRPGKKWDDGMDAITKIRNSLVHPNSKLEVLEGWYYEAWKLSLWYIAFYYRKIRLDSL